MECEIRKTKRKQSSSLEKNIINQQFEYKYINNARNRRSAQISGAIRDTVEVCWMCCDLLCETCYTTFLSAQGNTVEKS